MNILFGIFVMLHGLVHIWYVTLSQRWVDFQTEMGWTGESWLLSKILAPNFTRGLATTLYGLAALAFLAAGIGLVTKTEWARPWILTASILSAATILVFWDGSLSMLVEKGALGFLISAGILIAAVFFNYPGM